LLVTLAMAGNAPAVGMSIGHVDATGGTAGRAAAVNTPPNVRALALTGNPVALRVLKAPATTCLGEEDQNAPAAVQEAAMECLINYARQQAGLPRLNGLGKLDAAASNKAADILRCNEFSHEACGRDSLYWFRRSGYLNSRCWWAGENLAWGTGSLGTPRSVMKAWLRSPSHRANLLGSDYNQFGISLRVGGLSGSPDAHVWVNHFGRHC
jgi:uncharacterized protein YkwD